MNWILHHSDKMEFHTHLDAVLDPIIPDIKDLKWLATDLECNGSPIFETLPINYDHDYFILSPYQFAELVAADMQIIWGVFLGIPKHLDVTVDPNNLPYAESEAVWEEGNIQHENAVVEIICFDSSYTIVKFRDQDMSNRFKAYF
ncbi:MAG: hypothetical protein V4594_01425 [Bacteroidota bacterium]